MQAADATVVFAPYLEPVVRGRRVAVLGDCTRPLGSALLERGARLVHVYDPDPARVAQALALRGSSRTLMTAPLPEGDVAVRDGAFDAVLVPDLTVFDPVDSVVARARKLVASHGHAIFASPNPEAPPAGVTVPRDQWLSYYELYDVIALQFPEVRMLGQAPFRGYVIADFAPEGDPDVVVDTSLVDRETQEPRWFLGLGTQQPRRLDPYAIIQVPSEVGEAEGAKQPGKRTGHVAKPEAVQGPARETVPFVARVPASNERIEALEASLREREEALRRAESRAGDTHVRAGQLEGKVRDLEEELRHQRDRAFRLSNELEEEKKQRTKADLELRMVRSKSDMPAPNDSCVDANAEIARLESVVKKSEHQRKQLEVQLAEAKDRLADSEGALSAARDELVDIEASKSQVDATIVGLKRELKDRDARIEELDAEIVELQGSSASVGKQSELEQVRKALERAERKGEQASLAQQQAQEALEELRVERDEAVAHATRERDQARKELAKTRAGRGDVSDELQAAEDAREQAEVSLVAARTLLKQRESQLAALRKQDNSVSEEVLGSLRRERDEARSTLELQRQEHAEEMGSLERKLRECGQEILRLKRDVAHHEDLVRELLIRLEDVRDGDDVGLRQQLEVAVATSARQQGELQQARWRISELELKVREQSRPEVESHAEAELAQALFAAQNELDALRQAFVAEREGRIHEHVSESEEDDAQGVVGE